MYPVFNALTIIDAASSKRSRDSSIVPRKAWNSRRARPRPMPRPRRPLLSRSTMMARSATRRVVPGQDDRRSAEVDVGADGGEVGHQLQIVGAEGVVVEVVLDRPQDVEAAVGGDAGEADFLVPD